MKKISYAINHGSDGDYRAMCTQSINDVATKILEEVSGTVVKKLDSPPNTTADRDLRNIEGAWIGNNSKEALYI